MTTPAAASFAYPVPGPPVPDRLPTAAWALAWSSVLAQVVTVADQGVKTDEAWAVLVSMLAGALVIWWFASGVLSARTGRLVVTWVLLVVAFVAETVAVLDEAREGRVGMPVAYLLTSVLTIGSLWWFTRTPYFAWQRTRPTHHGPSRAGVLTVAVVVGLSAGLVQTDADAPLHLQVNASA